MKPAWKWLVVSPLAVVGFLQVLRDEVLTDPKYKKITVHELFDQLLPHWSLAIYAVIFLGAAFVLMMWGASKAYVGEVSSLRKALRTKQNERFYELVEQYDKLAKTQQRFWEILGAAHVRWSQSGSLDGLIAGAQIPSFLSRDGGRDSLETVQEWAANLGDEDRTLWNFVSEIYSKHEAGKLNSNTLSETELDAFHDDRRELVKFWNRCGELLQDGELPVQRLKDRFVPGQNKLLTVLIYLHLRVKLCLGTAGSGAQAIYRLPGRLWDAA